MKEDQYQRILDGYSYSQHQPMHEQIVFQKQLTYPLNYDFLEYEFPKKTPSSNIQHPHFNECQAAESSQPQNLDFSDEKKDLSHAVQDDLQATVEVRTQNQSEPPQNNAKLARSKAKPKGKRQKNQYDKNIFGNISKTIIKQILSGSYEQEIRDYCLIIGVEFSAFLNTFSNMDRQCIRMGTSELHSFLNSSQYSLGIRKVFSYFFVRYLRDEYVRYVTLQGRMHDKQKYLRCATKMMYIPKLTRNQYGILSEVVALQRL